VPALTPLNRSCSTIPMQIKLVLSLLAFHLFWAVPNAHSSTADDLAVKLGKRVFNYNLGTANFVAALIRVSSDFQVPIGISWVNSPAARAEVPFAWKEATLQEVIEGIAGTQSGYHVQAKNGVVHVWPSIPDGQNFLEMRIGEFNIQNQIVELAYFKLHTLVTPARRGNQQFSIAGPGDSKVTVELKNPTAEDVLDAIAVASNRKIWVVTFVDDAGLTPRGMRRTVSLWSPKPQPDEEQPGWDLFRWGDSLPPLVASTKQ